MLPHFIRVSGIPRARGRAYGEGLRDVIRDRDRAWKEHLGLLSGVAPVKFIAAHLEQSDYISATDTYAPGMLEEVEGISEGCGLSFADVFAAQLMDEEWLFHTAFRGLTHCSSLATARDGLAAAAQNMDLPVWMDGFQTILTVAEDSGLSAHVLTVAGMVGLCGVNSAGLALSVNTLSELPSSPRGLPVAFIARRVLTCRTLAEAVEFLERVPHAAGQNYVLADRHRVVNLECSAHGALAFRPVQARGENVWHTNHPLAGGPIVHSEDMEATGGSANSHARMAALDARLGPNGGVTSIDEIKAALMSRDDIHFPVSRPRGAGNDHGFTFASVIWQVAPEIKAHVSPGPPNEHPFQTLTFDD